MNTINTKYMFIVLLVILALASSAIAEITVQSGDLQVPLNYEGLEEKEKEISFSKEITLTNAGNSSVDVALSIATTNSDFTNVVLNKNSISGLAAGASDKITVTGKSPVDMDQGNNNFATLTINGATYTLTADVQSMLDWNKIYAYINGNEQDILKNDGEDITDVIPGDEIELKFAVENLFNSDYTKGDLSGTIQVQLDDSDFGDEVDEEVDFDLEAHDGFSSDDAPSIKFTVPSDAQDGTYPFDVTITSDDDNGAEYKTELKFDIEVNRARDDVRVESLIVDKAEISCDRKITLTAVVTNYGSDKQKYAALTIINEELGINVREDFQLDAGGDSKDTFTKKLTIEIGPKVAAKSTPYIIIAKSLYDSTKPSDAKEVELTVKSCATATTATTPTQTTAAPTVITSTIGTAPTTQTTTGTSANTPPKANATANQIASSYIVDSIEEPTSKDDYIIAALVIGIVLVFVLIILFIIVLLK